MSELKRFPDGRPKPFLNAKDYANLRDDDRFLYNETEPAPDTIPVARADLVAMMQLLRNSAQVDFMLTHTQSSEKMLALLTKLESYLAK